LVGSAPTLLLPFGSNARGMRMYVSSQEQALAFPPLTASPQSLGVPAG